MNDRYFELVSRAISRQAREQIEADVGSLELARDLKLCPLNLISIVLQLETQLALELPVEEVERLRTVAELAQWVRQCVLRTRGSLVGHPAARYFSTERKQLQASRELKARLAQRRAWRAREQSRVA